MNQIQAAAMIREKLNSLEDCRVTAKITPSGTVILSVSRDSGGKKGWLGVGSITVGEAVECDSGVTHSFRYDGSILSDSLKVEYSFEPAQKSGAESRASKLASAAKEFRGGKVVADDLVFECVSGGYLTPGEAMNSDY